jgi:hypothetical protein
LNSLHRPGRSAVFGGVRVGLGAAAAISAFALFTGAARPAPEAGQPHWTGEITVTYHESGSGTNGTTGGDVQAVYLVQRDQIVDLSEWVAYHSAQTFPGFCNNAQRIVDGLGTQHVATAAGAIGVTWSDKRTFALALPALTAKSTQHIAFVIHNRACSPAKSTLTDSFAVPLPDLTALRGNSKFPDIAGTATKSCTGCALQLGKPGFAATGDSTTTVTWDLVSGSAFGATGKTTARRYAIDLRTQCAELTVLTATLSKATGGGEAAVPAVGALAATCLYDSTQALAVSNDPADPHYKRIARASAPAIAPVVASGPLTPAAAQALTAYMRTSAKVIGAENALLLSFNRMTGARNANSRKFVRVQLKAAHAFALQLANAIHKRELAGTAAVQALHNAGIQNLAADPADLDAMRSQVLTGTFPPGLTDALKALNAPDAVAANGRMALALLSSGRLKTLPTFPELLADSMTISSAAPFVNQLRKFGTPPKPHHHHHKHKKHKP